MNFLWLYTALMDPRTMELDWSHFSQIQTIFQEQYFLNTFLHLLTFFLECIHNEHCSEANQPVCNKDVSKCVSEYFYNFQ